MQTKESVHFPNDTAYACANAEAGYVDVLNELRDTESRFASDALFEILIDDLRAARRRVIRASLVHSKELVEYIEKSGIGAITERRSGRSAHWKTTAKCGGCSTVEVERDAARSNVLKMRSPWSIPAVVKRLVHAANHLLHDHSCDVHGHEGIAEARDAGRAWLAELGYNDDGPNPFDPSQGEAEFTGVTFTSQ